MERPPVLFLAMQPRVGADGGTTSLGEVITRLKHHRPIVVADRDSRRVGEWRDRGIETHVVELATDRGFRQDPLGVMRSYLRYDRFLRRLLRQTGARVVHANDPAAFQLALSAVKRSRGVKIALNLRDTIHPSRRPPRRRFSVLFNVADHVFYLSEDMADRWAAVAPNAKRAYSVTYSIVDPVRFQPAPPPDEAGRPIVLLSGLIRPKKGQLEFLRDAAPALAASGIDTWLAGDFDPSKDEYMAACAEAARPLGDAVRFLGYRTDVPELMARSTVVAVASRHEGLVRAMIEAMASARPVVSFDVCSAREVLEEKSGGAGTVVRAGDYAEMVEQIEHYCRDRSAAAAAGRRGRETASRLFAPDQVVKRYEDVYRRLGASR